MSQAPISTKNQMLPNHQPPYIDESRFPDICHLKPLVMYVENLPHRHRAAKKAGRRPEQR